MESFRPASTQTRQRHVFLRNMVVLASVGVHGFEHEARQRIRINIDLAVTDDGAAPQSRAAPSFRSAVGRDDLSRVVDYEHIATQTRAIIAAGHVQLIETLAERLAQSCLQDPRIRTVRVRVEKLDIFDDIEAAGVEIERQNQPA